MTDDQLISESTVPPAGANVSDGLPVGDAFADSNLLQDVEIRFGYKIGDFRFVLKRELVTELLTEPNVYQVPRSVPWLLGLLNLRGNIIPVIDIAGHLGTRPRTAPGHYVLVADKGKHALAIVVDGLPTAMNSPQPQQAVEVTNERLGAYMSPGVISDNQAWVELDIKGLATELRNAQ